MNLLLRVLSIAAAFSALAFMLFGLGAFAGHPPHFVQTLIQFMSNVFPQSGSQVVIYTISTLLLVSITFIGLSVVLWAQSKNRGARNE